MKVISKDKFKLIGLRLENKTTNANNQSSVDCGNLWQKFETNKIFEIIPGKISNEIYAVYYDYEKDEKEAFSYFIGCMVDESAVAPTELDELLIPSQNYMKYTAKGAMTGCITEAWKKIWSSDNNRKFGFDFEVYDERSHNWNDAELDIYVSTSDE